MVQLKKVKFWYLSSIVFPNCTWKFTIKNNSISGTSSMIHKRISWQLLSLQLYLETKNGKCSHQKVCFTSWYVFMIMLQYSLKFFHWKLSKIFQGRCWLSIGTYSNKFFHFFFQVMTLFKWTLQTSLSKVYFGESCDSTSATFQFTSK